MSISGPAVMRDGEIVVQGRALKREGLAKRGFGMVKIIFRHGEKGNKSSMPPVIKEDIVKLPQFVRDFEPIVQDGVHTWRIPREDGRQLVIVTGEGALEKGQRLVTVFVDEASSAASKKRALSPL